MQARLLIFHPHVSPQVSSGLGIAEVHQPGIQVLSRLPAPAPLAGVGGQTQARMGS